jgi:hypothetical protein
MDPKLDLVVFRLCCFCTYSLDWDDGKSVRMNYRVHNYLMFITLMYLSEFVCFVLWSHTILMIHH